MNRSTTSDSGTHEPRVARGMVSKRTHESEEALSSSTLSTPEMQRAKRAKKR